MVPSVGKRPTKLAILATGDVMTKPLVADIAAIAESMSDRPTNDPSDSGAPCSKKTSVIAAATAARVAVDAADNPVIVKLIGFAIGAQLYTIAVTGCSSKMLLA